MLADGDRKKASNQLPNGARQFVITNWLIFSRNIKIVSTVVDLFTISKIVFLTEKKCSFLCDRIMNVVNEKPQNAEKRKVFYYDFTVNSVLKLTRQKYYFR